MKVDLPATLFGAFDGTTSVLGVVAGLASAHPHSIPPAAAGLAASSAVGMAGGDWLSDNGRSRLAAVTLGLATAVGTLLPALPFLLLTGTAALLVAAVAVVLVGGAISVARGNEGRDWFQTFVVLLAASTLTLAVLPLTGSSA